MRGMAKYELMINGEAAVIEAAADMPLLWALRDLQGLTGTAYQLRNWSVWRLYGSCEWCANA